MWSGCDHLGDAVEDLDPAGDDAALAGGQGAAQPVGCGVEEDELELGQRVADVDAVGAAAGGGRLVQADLDLDGDDLGQLRLADRGAQAAVDAGGRQRQDQVGRVGDLHPREQPRGLRPDPVEGGQLGEEREEDVGAAHGRGILGDPGRVANSGEAASRRAGCRAGSRPRRAGWRAPGRRRAWRGGGRSRRGSAGGGARPAPGRPRSACSRRCSGVAVAEVGAADDVGDALVRRRRPPPRGGRRCRCPGGRGRRRRRRSAPGRPVDAGVRRGRSRSKVSGPASGQGPGEIEADGVAAGAASAMGRPRQVPG